MKLGKIPSNQSEFLLAELTEAVHELTFILSTVVGSFPFPVSFTEDASFTTM